MSQASTRACKTVNRLLLAAGLLPIVPMSVQPAHAQDSRETNARGREVARDTTVGPAVGGGTTRESGELLVPRYALEAVSDGESVYVVGGAPHGRGREANRWGAGVTAVIERVDPVTLQARYAGSALYRRANHAAVYLNGRIWSFGGRTQAGTARDLTSSVEWFEPATGWYGAGPELPFALRTPEVAAIGDAVYLMGGLLTADEAARRGATNRMSDTLLVLRPPYERWEELAAMPLGVEHFAAVVIENEILVLGGWDGERPRSEVQIYDTTSGRWRLGGPLSRPLSAHGGVALAGQVYLFGDYDAQHLVLRYDPTTGRTEHLDLPFSPRRRPAPVVVGDRVLVLGGHRTSTGPALRTIEALSTEQLRAAPATSASPSIPYATP